jgi:hypothetical protein
MYQVIFCSQEILRFLWNTNVHYHIHKNSPLIPTLSLMNPIHTFSTYFPQIHSNIILPLLCLQQPPPPIGPYPDPDLSSPHLPNIFPWDPFQYYSPIYVYVFRVVCYLLVQQSSLSSLCNTLFNFNHSYRSNHLFP